MLESHRSYLTESVIPLRLACQTTSGWPLVLSLWYLYRDDALYCATQASARVVTHLSNDPRCAFEIASDQPPYCGVRGQAKARIVADQGEEILIALLERYLGGRDNPLARTLLKQRSSEVALCLQPISVYAWNYAERMQSTVANAPLKRCP